MIVGASRDNAQRVARFLSAQTIRERIEVIVVDVAPETYPPIVMDQHPATYLRHPGLRSWSKAKAIGSRQAQADLVAFLEDHCRPNPDWAEHVLSAFSGPWTAVGYGFTNGSADNYLSRSSLIADYGLWAHPAPAGESKLLPGNNVAYRKAFLDSLGDQLEQVLGVDYNLHEIILARGERMFLEPRAIAAHQCYADASMLLAANFIYARVLGATRARNRKWMWPMRLFAGLVAPILVPPLRLFRLFASLRGRGGLTRQVLAALPIVVVTYVACALGEATGYLFGIGNAQEQFVQYELDNIRV
jgi:hypothetical protein